MLASSCSLFFRWQQTSKGIKLKETVKQLPLAVFLDAKILLCRYKFFYHFLYSDFTAVCCSLLRLPIRKKCLSSITFTIKMMFLPLDHPAEIY